MSIKATEYVWHNGQLIPWDDAKLHVMAHVVNYGSSLFEGIRCYHTVKGPAIFRLRDHMQRLVQSAKIYRIELDYSLDKLHRVTSGRSCCAVMGKSASTPSTRRPRFTLPTTNGASILAAPTATMAWTCASRRGRVSRPTPCRRWRKPAPTT